MIDFKGSEKQIEWAKEIVSRFETALDKMIAKSNDPDDLPLTEDCRNRIAVVREFFYTQYLDSQTIPAGWVINHRGAFNLEQNEWHGFAQVYNLICSVKESLKTGSKFTWS